MIILHLLFGLAIYPAILKYHTLYDWWTLRGMQKMSWYVKGLCWFFTGAPTGIFVALLAILWEMIGAYWGLKIGIDPIEHHLDIPGSYYILGWIYAFGWALGVVYLAIIAHVKGLKINKALGGN